MAPRFLISTDAGSTKLTDGSLDFQTISYFGNVYVTVNAGNKDAVFQFVKSKLREAEFYVDVTELQDDIDSIILALNQGAAKAFVTKDQLQKIASQGLLENLSRLVLSVELTNYGQDANAAAARFAREVQQIVGSTEISFHLRDITDLKLLDGVAQARKDQSTIFPEHIFTTTIDNNDSLYRDTVSKGFVPVLPAHLLTNDSDKNTDRMSAHALLTTLLVSDRQDGLFTTVVTDERGVCLGVVYSNGESIREAIKTGKGVYHSRKRGLWRKGESSGDTQDLVKLNVDCDSDVLHFVVRQNGDGFCHLKTATCFGQYTGLSRLEKTLGDRKQSAPQGSYTARLFSDDKLLRAKILEEAEELTTAGTKEETAAEAADLFYFALTKCIRDGVSVADIEANLDLKNKKVVRRKGDAKPQYAEKVGLNGSANGAPSQETIKESASVPKSKDDPAGIKDGQIRMKRLRTSEEKPDTIKQALQRPSQRATDQIFGIARPIIEDVRTKGDAAVLSYTHKFEKATSLKSPVLKAPFPAELMQLDEKTVSAIDIAFNNIRTFHAAQADKGPLFVETMPGVTCQRHVRPIQSVGLYVPGGTAVLPSTALMLGVPAMVAGCETIVLACPPRKDGTPTPEVVYAAHKVGASAIVLAGGAQAIAALAYGTESIPKVDKILGPGNAFVTAAKMLVSNDTNAKVAIDMPAGPSEVLVIADKSANPAFVAADLLSQAEHGSDSQVVLIAIDLSDEELKGIEAEVHKQATALPRVDIVRGAIEHSVTFAVKDRDEALALSNDYAPEHLILQVEDAEKLVPQVKHAGSIFIGEWTPESVGDYAAGVNHSLPTYGYARQYSGVSLSSFVKHITASQLTKQGLENVGSAVMQLAKVEELEAHRRAVSIRLGHD